MSLSSRRAKLGSSSSSSAATMPTTSSSSSHKKDKKHKHEQDIPPPEVVEPPMITSPFDRLDEVWALPTHDKQRELVGQLFGIEDGPRMSLQAITLDDAFAHLLFAHRSGFTLDQTRVLYALLTQVRSQMSSPTATLSTVYASFRTYMLQHADIVRDETQRQDPTVVASIAATNAIIQSFVIPTRYQRPAQVLVINHDQDATRPPTAISRPTSPAPTATTTATATATATAAAPRPSLIKQKSSVRSTATIPVAGTKSGQRTSPSPSTKRPSSRNRNLTIEEEETESIPEPPKPLIGMFTLPQIQIITEYLTNGMFGHFELYQAVFNPSFFQPRTRTISQPIHIETVVPDRLHLWDALDLESEAKKLKQKQEEEQKIKADADAALAASAASESRSVSRQDDDLSRSGHHSTSNSRSQSRTANVKEKDKDKDKNKDKDKDHEAALRDRKQDGVKSPSNSSIKKKQALRT